jgi:hypothetical protein
MSKKSNTLIFILAATVFNVLITIIACLVLGIIYGWLLIPLLPEESAAWGFPIIFIAAIVISFVLYRVILKYIMKKVDMEKYFDPIFAPRRPPKRD